MRRVLGLFILYILLCTTAFAQPGFQDDEDPSIPLDGGVEILMVAAAVWGTYIIKKKVS